MSRECEMGEDVGDIRGDIGIFTVVMASWVDRSNSPSLSHGDARGAREVDWSWVSQLVDFM